MQIYGFLMNFDKASYGVKCTFGLDLGVLGEPHTLLETFLGYHQT